MLKSPIRPLLVRRLAPRPDTSGSAGRWQGSAAGGKQCKIVWFSKTGTRVLVYSTLVCRRAGGIV
eukprot:scaffold68327_cov39-Tisochrysis_lutea.AAC.1